MRIVLLRMFYYIFSELLNTALNVFMNNKKIAIENLKSLILHESQASNYQGIAAGLILCGLIELYYREYESSYEFFLQLVLISLNNSEIFLKIGREHV